MASSEVAICNSALSKIGAARIVSLNDDSKEAKICKEQYPKMRREVLRAHQWNFAIKRQELGLLALAPEFDFDHQFALPVDCLFVIETDLTRSERFTIEGRNVLCDSSTLKIRGVFDITDTTKYDAMFDEALAYRLSSEICYAITGKVQLTVSMYELYEKKVKAARTRDSQEGKFGNQTRADRWHNSRF